MGNRHVAQPCPCLQGFRLDIESRDLHRSRVGADQSHDHLDGGSLAGRVGAEDAENSRALSARCRPRPGHPEVFHHIVKFDHGRGTDPDSLPRRGAPRWREKIVGKLRLEDFPARLRHHTLVAAEDRGMDAEDADAVASHLSQSLRASQRDGGIAQLRRIESSEVRLERSGSRAA